LQPDKRGGKIRGPFISSAMVAAIGAGSLKVATSGLVPKQISTGYCTILGKTSKRGNRYLICRAARLVTQMIH
jgi:hypothetical protein